MCVRLRERGAEFQRQLLVPVRGESNTVSASGLQTGSSAVGPPLQNHQCQAEGSHAGTQADTQGIRLCLPSVSCGQTQERGHTCHEQGLTGASRNNPLPSIFLFLFYPGQRRETTKTGGKRLSVSNLTPCSHLNLNAVWILHLLPPQLSHTPL